MDILTKSNFLDDKLRFHPLGFIYSKLHEFENSEVIRIHVWNSISKIQEPLMNIHNHFYDVNSFVYCGTISNELYELSIASEPTHAIYSGSYINENTRILTKTELYKHLILRQRNLISKGNLYSIEKSEIHSGDNVNNETTITIVFSANPGNPTPLVFGPREGKDAYTYHSKMVDIKTANEIKKQIACA